MSESMPEFIDGEISNTPINPEEIIQVEAKVVPPNENYSTKSQNPINPNLNSLWGSGNSKNDEILDTTHLTPENE